MTVAPGLACRGRRRGGNCYLSRRRDDSAGQRWGFGDWCWPYRRMGKSTINP